MGTKKVEQVQLGLNTDWEALIKFLYIEQDNLDDDELQNPYALLKLLTLAVIKSHVETEERLSTLVSHIDALANLIADDINKEKQ